MALSVPEKAVIATAGMEEWAEDYCRQQGYSYGLAYQAVCNINAGFICTKE